MKLLLASAAALVIATPAMAQDAHGYVGIDAGALFPKSQSVFGNVDFTNTGNTDIARQRVANVKYKTGYDVDLIGGYDFGMFRLEGELGYKRAKAKSLSIDTTFLNLVNTNSGTVYTGDTDFGLNNHTSVYSAMLNGLVDFGGNGGIGGYVGAGAGYASVHQFGDSKGKFAWQLLAGVYAPVSSNIDVGLKYRYFRAGSNDSSVDYAFSPVGTTCGAIACSGGVATFDNDSRFTSHSLMLSLAYNFGSAAVALPPPPPPPPPAPMAPATQTCADGSVILATSMCPMAPPPPPPPAPVERGERGR
jgi:opacity protein-like surface antigen